MVSVIEFVYSKTYILKSVIMQTPFSFLWRMLIYRKMVVYVVSIE